MSSTATSSQVPGVLNRLLQTLSGSLALYVQEIRPWSLADDEPIWTALGRLAADCRMYAGRIAEAILEHGGQPEPGNYPLKFASLNDVGLAFFVREIVAHLERDRQTIGRCIVELPADSAVRGLAEEAGGNLQGHIELISKLVK